MVIVHHLVAAFYHSKTKKCIMLHCLLKTSQIKLVLQLLYQNLFHDTTLRYTKRKFFYTL